MVMEESKKYNPFYVPLLFFADEGTWCRNWALSDCLEHKDIFVPYKYTVLIQGEQQVKKRQEYEKEEDGVKHEGS